MVSSSSVVVVVVVVVVVRIVGVGCINNERVLCVPFL